MPTCLILFEGDKPIFHFSMEDIKMENIDNLGTLYMIILENDGPSTQSFLFLVERGQETLLPMQPPQALLSLK